MGGVRWGRLRAVAVAVAALLRLALALPRAGRGAAARVVRCGTREAQASQGTWASRLCGVAGGVPGPKSFTSRNILGQSIVRAREFSLDGRKTFTFVGSYKHLRDIPAFRVPEIAFVGRSNVGKSSMINCLSATNKPVAVRSKLPGCTQSINYFKVSDADGDICMIADNPGYGFARLSKEDEKNISSFVDGYLRGRDALMATFVLVDARLDPQESDVAMVAHLDRIGNPFAVIATKVDKLRSSERSRLTQLRQAFDLQPSQPLPFSAVTGEGRRAAWALLRDALLSQGEFGVEHYDDGTALVPEGMHNV